MQESSFLPGEKEILDEEGMVFSGSWKPESLKNKKEIEETIKRIAELEMALASSRTLSREARESLAIQLEDAKEHLGILRSEEESRKKEITN